MPQVISPGVVFPLLGPSGSAGAPSYSFSSAPTKGFYLFSASEIGFSGHLTPGADNTYTIGTAAQRVLSMAVTNQGYSVFQASGDANAAMLLNNNNLRFGAGGASGQDTGFIRNSTSGAGQISMQTNGTLTSSPADWDAYTIGNNLGGAFTVTRYNYIRLLAKTGAATVTDAAVFSFDNVPGTHQALAANGTVATVLGSLGPTGSQTTVQGWLKLNVNGTLRYVPFF